MKSLGTWSTFILFLTTAIAGMGQEPEIDPSQLPRIPATEPEKVFETFEISPGFQLRLVAHEPKIVDPIAMAFDEDGGMYVIEMRGYSERREEALGRIRYLEDVDGDGIFETSTIFKDGLKWPTGIVCYKGGVFVGATPDLYYFKDLDGDRVSDEERLVFTDFGEGNPRLNMQALFNSFRWGPDNRIWGATAANGGNVTNPIDPNFGPVSIRGADFSFDPEKLDLRPENGTAQYGMSFDSLGRRFVCSNSQHALWVAYERNHVRANPFYDLPAALVDIPNDGAAAPVYRISADEPWRVVRTRWRVSGVVKGMIEGDGRVSGYFTSATGIHAYWGNAYGEAYQNNLFVGDVGSNLVHRKVLKEIGGQVQPIAIRADDENQTEFLRSSDNWFRPASFSTGPDGCLYICDMYREVIEHPWSLPPGIKKHLDLNSGFDRGRIYRVEPEGFMRSPIPKLSEASNTKLGILARHAKDDWQQTTARRLLFERGNSFEHKAIQSPFPASLNGEESLIKNLSDWKGDPWLEAAILNSLRDESAIIAAWKHPSVKESDGFILELAKMSGRNGNKKVLEAALGSLASSSLPVQIVTWLTAFKDGVSYANGDWGEIERLEILSGLFTNAAKVANDSEAPEADRLSALRLLRLQSGNANEALRKSILVNESSSESLATEAVREITDNSFIIEHLDKLSSEARDFAVRKMISKPGDALQLLEAIDENRLRIEEVPADAIQTLREHENHEVLKIAAHVLPAVEQRSGLIERYQAALETAGDPQRGETIFNNTCLSCHQTQDGRGFVFGPPIATFKSAGKDSILNNILDPNKEVAPQYQAFHFKLNNSESYTGMIAAEDSRNVTLMLPGGINKIFPRSEVGSMSGIGRSLMPEGLEHTFTINDMADLLSYLTQ